MEAEAAAGDAEDEEEEILAPEGQPAAHQRSDSPKLPPEDNEQDLEQVQAFFSEPHVAEGDEAGVEAAEEAAVDVEVEGAPAAAQEEGAESEHPLAYHPISRVLTRPTMLRPAVTGYPTLRIDRTGIWHSSRRRERRRSRRASWS